MATGKAWLPIPIIPIITTPIDLHPLNRQENAIDYIQLGKNGPFFIREEGCMDNISKIEKIQIARNHYQIEE
jgi:hypothetical protein